MGKFNKSTYKTFDSQEIDNREHDQALGVKKMMPYGQDGVGGAGARSDFMAIKKTVAGSVSYLAYAAPGTAEDTAKWQAMKVDETTGMRLTWADGNANFDNIATDLTSLTYS